MLTYLTQIHWPTFFISFTLFIILASFWSLVRALMAKSRADKQVKKAEKVHGEMMNKLKEQEKKAQELLEKYRSEHK